MVVVEELMYECVLDKYTLLCHEQDSTRPHEARSSISL